MTAPHRSTPQSQLSASQTAPVAEFRCLYTPDIRKKQKKWQDGYLKFHTFNNRVMVYDQARNFLGDTYYKDSNELHEGDELTLDKGVMVEVADAMGVTQTDLTPLFEKKPKDPPPPPTAPPRRFQPPSQVARPQVAPSNVPRANAQMRHKSLNTLLGTPKGPIGKSVPIKSPYETRQEKEKDKKNENEWAADRAAKRQKTTHSSTSSATLRQSSPVHEDNPALRKTPPPPRAKSSSAKTASKSAKIIPPGAPVIDLDAEPDVIADISSDISWPTTPPKLAKTIPKPVTPAPAVHAAPIQKPVLQTPRIPRGKVPVPSVKALEALETPKARDPGSSPPVSASNRLTNVDFAIQSAAQSRSGREAARTPSKQLSPPPPPPPPQSPPRNLKAKSLRLSVGVKRGTLMCQALAPPRVGNVAESRLTASKSKASRAQNTLVRAPSPAFESDRVKPSAPKAKRKATTDVNNTRKKARNKPASPEVLPNELDDDQEIFHGLLDQQLIVSPVLPDTLPSEPVLVPDSPKQTVSKPMKAVQGSRKPSPPIVAVAVPPQIQSRAASPALSAVSDSRSRTTSLSPRKLAALSTGGFRKRTKRATPQPTVPTPDTPAAPEVHRNETVALPPHPLRANKKGPVMTTTELAAMLQQPKNRFKTSDPIEDDALTTGKSPSRNFRRVRSENDAPIPSTSDDWEQRNLAKPTTSNIDTAPIEATAVPAVVIKKTKGGLAALVKKTDPRKKFARTQSLNVDTSMAAVQDVESPMGSPVVDKDVGPWSTEAADLFDWRPPRGEEMV